MASENNRIPQIQSGVSGFERPPNYYEMPYTNSQYYQSKKTDESSSNYIPVGMSLFIFQSGKQDLTLTLAWRAAWLVSYLLLWGLQFLSFEPAIFPFRLSFWSIILSVVYFLTGLVQVAQKALDKSKITRMVQLTYVVAYSFSVGTSLFYIFLLFMDDINRNNPRKDHIYIVMADGYVQYPYLKTYDSLKEPACETEFTHPRNLEGTVVNSHRYNFFWFYHVCSHLLLPLIMMVPLYVENTRIYYFDFLITLFVTVVYTAWLWIGSVEAYNRDHYTPCIGTRLPRCNENKVNPEYRTIYSKLNFYQRGETAAYVLLLYFFVFMAFYLGRQISKRYARSALITYKNMAKELPAAEALQTIPQLPDEKSSRGDTDNKVVRGAITPRNGDA